MSVWKKPSLLLGLIFIFTFLLPIFSSPSLAQATTISSPSVTTVSANNIGDDGATLNGKITSDGGRDITEYGFYYGTSLSKISTKDEVGTNDISEGDTFSDDLSLDTDTTYYFQAYAKNSHGTTKGSVKSFTTGNGSGDGDKPSVTTNSATDIGDDYATFNGRITSDGGDDITEYGFYYGTSSSSVSTKDKVGTDDISEGDTFSDDLDLDTDTTYYFKAYAKNANGTSYGSVKSFTTDSGNGDKPSVTTNTATDISGDSATLNGKITSDGGDDITEYGFYYGTTSSCSSKDKVGTDDVSEGDSFSDSLSLNTNQKYYFKAYAKNSNGTSYGSVKSFTTGNGTDKPTVTTITPVTAVGFATLYGVVTSNGDSDISSYGFYYGTSSSPGTKVEVGDSNISENLNYSYGLTGLVAGATYYAKAYATNDSGTGYGSVLSFKVGSAASSPSVFTIGSKTYNIKGVTQLGDVMPYIKNSRTYLPIHYVAWALGITESNIVWNETAQTVTLTRGATTVVLKINSNIMYVNGSPYTMDTVPEITANRTCLPVAFVVQAFGSTAVWNGISQTVTIQ